ncbi:MAG TPA: hypothetical protein VKX16_00490 [Chloroflexota bacterium]|nr:hypothetical protein [Chloroflexota bacterium]
MYVTIIFAVIGIPLLVFILWHFRRQRDFEGTGRTPPEDYD